MSKEEKVDNTPFWRIPQWFPKMAPEVEKALRTFHNELIAFNGRINLISNRTERHSDLIHFADCIMAGEALLAATNKRQIHDLGSGNGLPGLVIAALDRNRRVILVEKDARKCEFLKHASSRMGLSNITVHNDLVEDLEEGCVECAVSRGFAQIGKAILAARKACAPGAEYYHFKGDTWAKEIADIPPQVFGHWKPKLTSEYVLPEDSATLSLVCTVRIN